MSGIPRTALLVGAVLLLASWLQQAQAEVLLVYSVQRHGARNVLPKTSTLKESAAAGGPTLLPEGQRQAFNAGLAYRARYLNASTCASGAVCLDATVAEPGPEYGVVGSPDGAFNNYNTLVRSSALDRTIMTARSFLDAVFPAINAPTSSRFLPDGEQVVPVYSMPDDGDTLIRGYTACPAYDTRLQDWYSSSEFRDKEQATATLRSSISALAPGLDTSLKNWWNVYDGFNVYRTYGVGTPMPTMDNATFAEMQALANWLETAKMRSSMVGNLLGGAMLADLLSYMGAAVAAVSSNLVSPVYYKLVHVSGHYNTQLGLLGALGIDQLPAAAGLPWLSKIPALAALMAFELHADSPQRPQELAVRLVMQDGPAANYTPIPLPCAVAGDGAEVLAGPGACTLEAFKALVQPKALNGTDEWCDACQNDSMTACQLRLASQALNATASRSGGGSGSGLSGGAVAGIIIGCVVGVLALCGVAFALYHRRMQRQLQEARITSAQTPPGFLPGTV